MAESDAMVVGKMDSKETSVLIFSTIILTVSLFLLLLALTVQLENLQLVVNAATTAVNAHGPLLINRLHDVPMRA